MLLGKTTTPEFGWKGVTDSPLDGITRNPWNTAMTPGGSSGGAAAALAAGMSALALGTDGGGSLRIPAGFTSIVGMKATFGRVPAYPFSPSGTLANVGPLARSVTDCALLLNVLCEPDPRDAYSLPYDSADYLQELEDGVEGLKIAYSATLGAHSVDPEIAALVCEAVDVLAGLGAEVVETCFDLHAVEETFRKHWYAGAATLLQHYDEAAQAAMDPGLLEIAGEGRRYSLLEYLRAVAQREQLIVAANRFHQSHHLLVTPTLPLPAFPAGAEVPPGGAMQRWPEWTPFTYPFKPHAAAGDQRPLRAHGTGPARRPADHRPALRRPAGAARRARLREGKAVDLPGSRKNGEGVATGARYQARMRRSPRTS